MKQIYMIFDMTFARFILLDNYYRLNNIKNIHNFQQQFISIFKKSLFTRELEI